MIKLLLLLLEIKSQFVNQVKRQILFARNVQFISHFHVQNEIVGTQIFGAVHRKFIIEKGREIYFKIFTSF